MARLTVQNLKNSRIPAALGLCLPADNTRFLQWLNEAEERLLAYGRWIGSIQEAQFCVREGCLTWPREVQTVEQVAICGQPIPLYNAWYEFTQQLAQVVSCDTCCGSTGSGSCSNTNSGAMPGLLSCGHVQMRMRAKKACSFASTKGANKVIRLYPTHSSDVGKTVLVQGYDLNNIWVRTNPTGTEVIDGELVTLALPSVDTTTVWYPGQPTAIQKDVTNYRVLMYEYDTVTTLERQLGDYQATETNPEYQVSFIPGFSQIKCCGTACSTDDDCNPLRTVTALVKLAHVDVSSDRDWVLFQNIAAYKEAMLAVRDWENGDIASGNFHFYGATTAKQARASNQATLSKGGAIPMLRAELRSVTGDNTTVFVHHENDLRLQYDMIGFR